MDMPTPSSCAHSAEVLWFSAGNAPLGELVLRAAAVGAQEPQYGSGPDPKMLGNVLDLQSAGKEWQVVLLDPNRVALEGLRHMPGVLEAEEEALRLEEMYLALLAR